MYGLVICAGVEATLCQNHIETKTPVIFFEESSRIIIFSSVNPDQQHFVLDLDGITFSYIIGEIEIEDSTHLTSSCEFISNRTDVYSSSVEEVSSEDNSVDEVPWEYLPVV